MGYYALAIIMVVTPAAVIIMTYIFGIYDKWIFIVETVGIVMFSAYWALKSYELSMSKAEKKAMMGQMQTDTSSGGKTFLAPESCKIAGLMTSRERPLTDHFCQAC